MLRYLLYGILIPSICIGCQSKVSRKQQLQEIVNLQLEQLELESYPEIEPCKETSEQCFNQQLLDILELSIPESITEDKEQINDTLWIRVIVKKDGYLKTVFSQKTSLTKKIQQRIDSSLVEINPIKPGHVRGIPVTCNFKLPLILNKDLNIE